MFRSPLDILTGAAGALAGLYLLFRCIFSDTPRAGLIRDHRGFAVFLSLLLIATGILAVLRTWKRFFVDSRLPSPPKLFKDDPADKNQR